MPEITSSVLFTKINWLHLTSVPSRHSTGFYLANNGHDTRAIQSYLGHSNIKNTVIYTELSPQRFKNFWQD
jgi:site-specific recombinase XerD